MPAWQLPGLPSSPTQQSASRTYSKKDTMVFSVGEAATTATSGVVREEKQEQLTYSCYIPFKPSKWAMADSTILVQRSAKYSLREKVDRLYVSRGTISKHCKMCSTVINTEYKVENHIYEVPYNNQYLTYTRQCREVTKQCEVGSHSYEVLYYPQFYDYTIRLR